MASDRLRLLGTFQLLHHGQSIVHAGVGAPASLPLIFTLRLWQEPINDEQHEWRGELKNLSTGELRYIQLWKEINPMKAMLGILVHAVGFTP